MNHKETRADAHNPSTNTPDATAPVNAPFKPPISDAKLAANRQNAQHSQGPVTPAGLAASSQNRTVHGLARHNGEFRLLPMEKQDKFDLLQRELAEEHQPSTPTEAILVNTMAESLWLKQRSEHLQETCLDYVTGQIKDAKMFALYLRYQTTHTRAFHKCLNDLLKLRSERRKAEVGFEAQNRQEEELRIKNEKHEMKKQSHQWDVLRKDAEACHQLALNTIEQIKAQSENPGFDAKYNEELAKRGMKQDAWGFAEAAA